MLPQGWGWGGGRVGGAGQGRVRLDWGEMVSPCVQQGMGILEGVSGPLKGVPSRQLTSTHNHLTPRHYPPYWRVSKISLALSTSSTEGKSLLLCLRIVSLMRQPSDFPERKNMAG